MAWSWNMHRIPSYFVHAAEPKKPSAENGPNTSWSFSLASFIAGMMISSSSFPYKPPSPLCGLSPMTAMRGYLMPKSCCSVLMNTLILLVISSFVMESAVSLNETWFVTLPIINLLETISIRGVQSLYKVLMYFFWLEN